MMQSLFCCLTILSTSLMVSCNSSEPNTAPISQDLPHVGSVEDRQPFFYQFNGEIDESIWTKGLYSFEGNASVLRPSQVISGSEYLTLQIDTLDSPEEGRLYASGQLETKRFFSYGTFTVSMSSPIPSGTVSSFFLMNKWESGHWLHREIDIEFLGNERQKVQYNLHRFYADTESAQGSPYLQPLDFDMGEDFHNYAIVWSPDKVEWKVDGVTLYSSDENIPDEPLNIFINHWLADPQVPWAEDWLGPFNPEDLPSVAKYAWVRYEPLTSL
ncbi:MAG: family 16 glycosylhydrolase [Spirochaetaceae bacterium]|jgi:beta-glucanase (GH16 family)|nr:family 16 glycosylhydrolase [Spirochaetaceae bacterium]